MLSEAEKKEEAAAEPKKTRRVVYIGGHYGPEANIGGIGYCRVGEGPRDIDEETAALFVVKDGVFRNATPEDEPQATEAAPAAPADQQQQQPATNAGDQAATTSEAAATNADGEPSADAPAEEATAQRGRRRGQQQ
jgi:hypothetical protein